MKRALAALAAMAFLCLPASAQETCQPGASIAEYTGAGARLVTSGALSEVIVLQGDSLKRYVASLNSRIGTAIPLDLSHFIVAVPVEGDKVNVVGFHNGCRTGGGAIPKQVHQEAYGQEVSGETS